MTDRRVQAIKLLLLDVDGILTDGVIARSNAGDEYRAFHVHDGLGMRLWHQAGGLSGIITSKRSAAVRQRAREMQITALAQNVRDKKKTFAAMLKRFRLSPAQACYLGDDLIDIPVLKIAGFSVTVPEGPQEVKRVAHYVTQRSAGRGAVRETVEYILKAQGKWDAVIEEWVR